MNDYQPGITELRLNVKSAHVNIISLNKDLREVKELLSKDRAIMITMLSDIVVLKDTINSMRAKLFEAGVR